ncbi:MAG TPA: ATP-dependent DNA helicase RecQ [Xylanibacter oryzae]|nr:ATP-dependent DNA helicase RecQ [Xylanibacter oryzae]
MEYKEILKTYWGYDDFRGIQKDIIESIGAGKDTLGLMPTGGGKSITFQVPALAMDGVCIVITPLIALMKDQVMNLKKRGIKAAAIYSGLSHEEIITTLENCIFGGIKILYISPERLSSKLFLIKLKHTKVSFITVDEAHCISQWGYDFRPAYLKIADVRDIVGKEIPVLALTATATPNVVKDIEERLYFTQDNVFRMSFERKNLAYIVRIATDKRQEMIHILSCVGGSAIVYTRSRRKTKETAQLLLDNGISATYYHAGLDHSVKDERQKEWQNDKVRVMVSTNAFGMGIDKPDVRTVIHIDCPDSIEAYFQEAGRAGRDGKKSYAVLLYNNSDKRKLDKRITDTFPEKDYIKTVYDHLAYYYQIGVGSGQGSTMEFNIDKFCRTFKHFPTLVDSSLKILERAGYIEYDDIGDDAARVIFLLERNELYRLNNQSKDEEAVITALLRCYGGLFSDYVYIDEGFLAQQAGIKKQNLYIILKNLSARHIIHFIPQRRMPTISYTLWREDSDKLYIGNDVYEERRNQYSKRIYAMIDYASNDYLCRSRQLLMYFGEKDTKDCNQCDVCNEHKGESTSGNVTKYVKEKIMEMLKDKKPHMISDLNDLSLPENQLNESIANLINEEILGYEDGFIFIK